jgi:VWFA-related protein
MRTPLRSLLLVSCTFFATTTSVPATSVPWPAFAPSELRRAWQGRAADPVSVEFFVVSPDGTPIPDLKAEEVVLRVGGRPRTLLTLQWVRAAPLPPGPEGRRAPRVAVPFGSNVPFDAGRSVVVIIDDDSFRPGREQPLREAVRGFIAGLSSRDRLALVTVPYGGLKVDFTVEHERIINALMRIVGQAPQNETGSELACRTRRTLESVTGLLGSLGGGVGPTTVVFVSSALAAPRRDAAMAMAPGMCELTTDHFQHVGAATAAARAHFYVVQPEDTVVPAALLRETIAGASFDGSDHPLVGLEHLTGVTGGHRLPMLTSRDNNLIRIARETSGYYVASFVPDSAERNGNAHRVDVKVSRENAAVRARPAVVIPRPARNARTPSPQDMLRETRVFRDLPLRTAAYPSLNDAKTVKLLSVIEPIEPGVTFTAAAAGLIDEKGRLVAQSTATNEELKSTPVIAAMAVPPGRYRLRMAATDATGRAGSADYDVAAELLPAGGLTMSALVLGLSRGGFRPMLTFGAEPAALAYLELYGATATPPTVTVELSLSEDGPALLAMPAAVADTKDESRRFVTAALPIGSLPAGDYVVRAIVSVDGKQARTYRTLRKQPR